MGHALTGSFRPVATAIVVAGLALLATAAIAGAQRSDDGQAGASQLGSDTLALSALGSFSDPTYVAQPEGERRHLYVVEQSGRILVIRAGKKLTRPFLDIRKRVGSGGERGMFSVAFAPDYERSRKFYVNYTDNRGDTRIVEYRRSKRSASRANHSTARTIIRIRQPASNHNGGQLAFGSDDLLYIGMGDGGGGGDEFNNAQDRGSLLGKMLRIDPSRNSRGRRYRIPRSNPYVGRSGRDEIWASGLRNPYRFSFDRGNTRRLFIGDVGQGEQEEIDYVTRRTGNGANFGWAAYEGPDRFRRDVSVRRHTKPVFSYSHSAGGCSVTGGYVVRDEALPTLEGRYLYGDFCQGELRSLRPKLGGATGDRSEGITVPQLRSFGEDSSGRIHVVAGDVVYRLRAR
ncbi:MAG: PQQ-dependent sugar dehydrogenase [Solirubrobacterales bacterium]